MGLINIHKKHQGHQGFTGFTDAPGEEDGHLALLWNDKSFFWGGRMVGVIWVFHGEIRGFP